MKVKRGAKSQPSAKLRRYRGQVSNMSIANGQKRNRARANANRRSTCLQMQCEKGESPYRHREMREMACLVYRTQFYTVVR